MPTTLSIAEMKEHVRRHFEDFVNNRKPEVIRRNMTEDFFDHDGPGGKPTGVQGDEEMMRSLHQIFPGLHITNRWQGTNSKTGRRIEFHGFVEWRFEGDRIAERWATVTPPTETA
jgi:hypothetical protein